jgi:ferrochelatase
MCFNHPGFIEPVAEQVRAAFDRLGDANAAGVPLLFTAHSIPLSMAENCRYQLQLEESCRLVAEAVGNSNYKLVYQSRSGPPQQPWLEPDVCDYIRDEHAAGRMDKVVIVPIGFVSDHMEVLYDLDTEAHDLCHELGIAMQRAATVGTHPRFVQMIRELVIERMTTGADRPALGTLGPSHDVCPLDCCTYVAQRPQVAR